ncbi:hypothetical protein AB205_0182820, partial [Aquarana catesbeiana]
MMAAKWFDIPDRTSYDVIRNIEPLCSPRLTPRNTDLGKESLTETLYHMVSRVQSRLITMEAIHTGPPGMPLDPQGNTTMCPGSCQSVPRKLTIRAHSNAYHCQCHQGCLSVPHISAAYQCPSVPRINAHQCRLSVPPHQCPAVPPFSAQCRLSVPISANQCRLSMPISAAYQCRISMPIVSACSLVPPHWCCRISVCQ